MTGFARRTRRHLATVATVTFVAASLAACGGSDGEGTGKTGVAPDMNGDGKVVIGVLSPGDINDNGFYQGFVDSAQAFADEQGWELIKRGSVKPSDALGAARALCQQKVDMVALGASELKDAVPASEEPVCRDTVFYAAASDNVTQTEKVVISSDDPVSYSVATGYAAGLKMLEAGSTQAGFVSGIKADFSQAAEDGFLAGIRLLVPDATVVSTYTGDFDDAAKAKEAVQAQMSQGVSIIYPYLGGATDAAGSLAQEAGVMTVSPGTDRCASTAPKFDISAVYNAGDYFAAALADFAANDLEVGTTRTWKIGVDPFPLVKLCDASDEDNAKLEAFMQDLGADKIDAAAEVARLVG